jgi:hypothetical protein
LPVRGQTRAAGSVIHAEIIGSHVASALGITVRAEGPVLELCRRLIDAGFDPETRVEAYRGAILCLTIRSIGWGVEYTIMETSKARPYLVRWNPFPSFSGRPPIRQTADGLSDIGVGTKRAPAAKVAFRNGRRAA